MKSIEKQIHTVVNLYKLKQFSKAEILAKELLIKSPKIAILYNVLGLIMAESRRIKEAISYYETGIEIDPRFIMFYNNLGNLFKSIKNFEKAKNYYFKAIKLDNKAVEPYNNLGNLYIDLNERNEAIKNFKKAIEINPNFLISHYNLAILYKSIGKFNEAKLHLEKIIEINELFLSAHRTLSQIIKYTKDEPHLKKLKKIYSNTKIKNDHKIEILYALGKASDDLKEYKDACKYFIEANRIRRKQIIFSIDKEKNDFDSIRKFFTIDNLEKNKKSGNETKTPIFILGMPRSGTTLVEQIISSHPNVYGGDELNFIPLLVKKYLYKDKSKLDQKSTEQFYSNKFFDIGNEYIELIQNISNNKERVTDKLPINFKWIGFIKLILPNCKIIHCKRNPKDNCLSIFKTFFANPSLNFAYDLDELFKFYGYYEDLMKYWHSTIPNFIYDINYESLINTPNDEIRNVLQFCDLEWSEQCLEFYNNQRPIKTASDTQVRKKIYKSSINIWKNYNIGLKNFFDKFEN